MNNEINNMSERDLILALIKRNALQEKKIDELSETVKELITYIGNFNEPMNKANTALDKEDEHGIYQMFRNVNTKFVESKYLFDEFYSKNINEMRELNSMTEKVRNRLVDVENKLDKLHDKVDKIKQG